MTQQTQRLFNEALQLPEGERGDLAAQLLDSLDGAAEEDVETAWSAEIKDRLGELEAGTVQPIPWPQARRMILEDRDDAGSA